MNILWFTWKDPKHPEAGGAEKVNDEIAKRLVADGHTVQFIVGGFEGCAEKDAINGYAVHRVGNRYSVYLKAWRLYRNQYKNWADLSIEEINTVPFFTRWYIRGPRALIVYQLARQVWRYQMKFPFSAIGYFAEFIYMRLLRKEHVLTISDSSMQDLIRQGFDSENISLLTMGSEITPLNTLVAAIKGKRPAILSVGSVRPMKQTLQQIEAFEIAKKSQESLKMVIAGNANGAYGEKVLARIKNSPHSKDIEYVGSVSAKKKQQLMQQAHVILVTSVKEGWGLIVTEAASQGTPAIVYDADGLRDSALKGVGGWITDTNPEAMAAAILESITNSKQYSQKQLAAWKASKAMTFDQTYADFCKALNL